MSTSSFVARRHCESKAFKPADVSSHFQRSIGIFYNSELARWRESIEFEFRVGNSRVHAVNGGFSIAVRVGTDMEWLKDDKRCTY